MALITTHSFEVLLDPPSSSGELEPPVMSYTITYQEPSFNSACFYIPATDGTADDNIKEIPYINSFPSDGILREEICRGGAFDVVTEFSLTFTPHRTIDPITLPTPAQKYTVTYEVPFLEWNTLPYYLTLTYQEPEVRRNVWGESLQPYGLLIASSLVADYEIFYRVPNYFDLPYKIRVFSFIEQSVPFTTPVAPSAIEFTYELNLYTKTSSENEQPYVIFTESFCTQNYGINGLVPGYVELPYELTASAVSSVSQLYDLLTYEPVVSSVYTVWSLAAESTVTTITSDVAYITVGSTRIDLNDLNVSLDEESFAWDMSALIGDQSLYNQLPLNTEFVLTLLGEDFTFLVDSRKVTRGSLDNATIQVLQLNGLSPTMLLDAPRADPYTRLWDVAASAKSIVEDILSDNGFTKNLVWNVDDWSIPADRVAITDGSPIRVIESIAEATGAVATTNKDGDLVINYKFPICPVDWNASTADHTLTDSEHILEFSEDLEVLQFYDSVRVRDIVPTYSDNLTWVPDDSTSGKVISGTMELYLSPPRSSATLKTSGGAAIAAGVEEYKSQEEDVEFRDGQGTTTKPIHSIQTVVWYERNLGALSFEQFSTNLSTSSTETESVARVTYTAQARTHRITYSKPIPANETVPAQFYIEDSDL